MANVVQPNVNTAAGPTSTWQYKKNGAGGRFGAPPPPVVPERSREDMHSTEACIRDDREMQEMGDEGR